MENISKNIIEDVLKQSETEVTKEDKIRLYDGLLSHVLFCEEDDQQVCYDVLIQCGFSDIQAKDIMLDYFGCLEIE